jgi:hypothetical protein
MEYAFSRSLVIPDERAVPARYVDVKKGGRHEGLEPLAEFDEGLREDSFS